MKKKMTRASTMVKFSSWVLRVFVMTINNKNKTKIMTEAITSVHLLLVLLVAALAKINMFI